MRFNETKLGEHQQAERCLREKHKFVVDSFAQLPSVYRAVDGNVWCRTRGKPVALLWNSGHPVVCN